LFKNDFIAEITDQIKVVGDNLKTSHVSNCKQFFYLQ
jgi:hypothetical protein